MQACVRDAKFARQSPRRTPAVIPFATLAAPGRAKSSGAVADDSPEGDFDLLTPLLVNAKNNRVLRRIQIESNDICDLGGKLRISVRFRWGLLSCARRMRDTERLDRFSFPPSKRVVQRERPAGGGESASVSTLCFCSWPQIKHIDAKIELAVKSDERAKRLTTIPSVGPVTAVTFIALVDEIARFSSSAKLCSYLGLVPREHSSGEKQQRGHITKTGNSRLRSLLVECAWGILRRANPRTEALSQWALRIAARRGKRIAAIALARKLAAILFAMTQHGRDFEPDRIRRAPQAAAA